MDEPIASTAQALARHLRQRPDDVALILAGTGWSYRRLAELVVRFTNEMRAHRIGRGTLVGIACGDRVTHLLLMLACEILAAPTVSFLRVELTPDNSILAECDLVFVDDEDQDLVRERSYAVTAEWIQQVSSAPIQAGDWAWLDVAPDPKQIVRLVKTSGTTGEPKMMLMPAELNQQLIPKYNPNFAEDAFRSLKFVMYYNFTVRSSYGLALMTLQTGGTVIFSSKRSIYDDIQLYGGNYCQLLVGDAERVAADVPATFAKPEYFGVLVGGGLAGASLRAALKRALATHIVHPYSSNEAGRICLIDESGVGTLYPEARASIVGDDGVEKPYGEIGIIRVKTNTMIDGYYRNPALTVASFVDGWFHTGDAGMMPGPGRLIVVGRADDMLNVGGVKIAPGPIEDAIKAFAGVVDAVAVCVMNENAVGRLAVAIETTADADRIAIGRQVAGMLDFPAGSRSIVFIGSLPRTSNGKVRRKDVEHLVGTAIARA